LLAGLSMTGAYFDTNPPMSFLIYIPAALLQNLGVPAWHAINIYTGLLLALSIALSWGLLQKLESLTQNGRKLVIFGYYISLSVGCLYAFGMKDQLIAIMLLPFLLTQIVMLEGGKTGKLGWAALILSTPFILLKPHYGLLPTALLVFRFIKTRRLGIVFDADFLCLAIGVLAYVATLIFFFPDFLSTALPAIVDLYITIAFEHSPVTVLSVAATFLSICMAVLCYHALEKKELLPEKTTDALLALYLSGLCFLAIIAYCTQGQGFTIHAIPVRAIGIAAFFLMVSLYLQQSRHLYLIGATLNLFFVGLFLFLFFKPQAGTREFYSASPFAKFLTERAVPNGYLVETGTTGPFWQVSTYTGIPMASRFPSLWFLGGIVTLEDHLPQEQWVYTYQFAKLIAEDIETKKPELLLLIPKNEGGAVLNMLAREPSLKAALADYKADGFYDFDYAEYGRFDRFTGYGKTKFEIYTRK
jgi:hypothetical protein